MQAELKRKITLLIREEASKSLRVKCGWYTEKQMKEVLHMCKRGS